MRKWREQLKKWIIQRMDLPEDTMLDLPRITMVGQLHIYIENHRGVLRFSSSECRLLLQHGQLLIEGKQFVIKTILPEEILLEGEITQVRFLDERGQKSVQKMLTAHNDPMFRW